MLSYYATRQPHTNTICADESSWRGNNDSGVVQYRQSLGRLRGNVLVRRIISIYISLTKPGVLFGNVITGAAGFLLASGHFHTFNVGLMAATIIGMTLIIGSACALNNVLDRDIDQIMERTRRRAVASGGLPPSRALVFSIVLGVVGFAVLLLWSNWLVVWLGLVGFVTYVWLYGAITKRRSVYGTHVGGISGAMPILAGYCAVSGKIDTGALLIFAALFFWQFPEFFSIAIYRLKEYAAAGVPLMPVVKGVSATKLQIFLYTTLFCASVLLLTPLGYTGYAYAFVMAIVCGYWVWLAARGLAKATIRSDEAWARRMFRFSLNALLIYSFMIALGPLLP